MDRYPNISDHGLIGDLQTAALVTTDGTVDFFCCPRFDSPSVFASLLDAERAASSDRARRRRLRDQAAVLPRHRDADHPVHDPGRRRRGARLHAGHRGQAHRPAPAGAAPAGGPRHHAVRSWRSSPVSTTAAPSTRVEVSETARCSAAEDGMELTLHTAGRANRRQGRRRKSSESETGCARRSRCARARAARRRARVDGRPAAGHRAGRAGAAGRRHRPRTGSAGWAARPTPGGGGRWSPARR